VDIEASKPACSTLIRYDTKEKGRH